jgi:bifunctional non-homologous end joining protein LigD
MSLEKCRRKRRFDVISDPDKVLWPDDGYIKRDLVRHYNTVFSRMASYLTDRLLTFERCPDGLKGECFYERERPDGLPPGVPVKRVRHEHSFRNYVVGGRRDTLLALANLACIAVHVSGTRATYLRQPDWVCFDLDPQSGRFGDAVRAARLLKDMLDALGLHSFPKTTGGRGVHVFVPIRIGPTTDDVRGFAQAAGARLAAAHPDVLTVEPRVEKRQDLVYLDPFRNGFTQTVVAPYSVRRRPKAPVSTPLAWEEVTTKLNPARFTMETIAARLRQPDPWAQFFRRRQDLRPVLKALAAGEP